MLPSPCAKMVVTGGPLGWTGSQSPPPKHPPSKDALDGWGPPRADSGKTLIQFSDALRYSVVCFQAVPQVQGQDIFKIQDAAE